MTSVQSPTERLYWEALKYIPGGTSRLRYHYTPFPIDARSAGGCRLIDVDRSGLPVHPDDRGRGGFLREALKNALAGMTETK